MNRRCFLSVCATGLAASRAFPAQDRRADDVKELCRDYLAGFGSPATQVCYHHRLNGPRGLGALEKPEQIAKGLVNGQPKPFGYGSGIQDVPLENGQLLFALCDAYEATRDEELARTARWIFTGFKRVATVSPEPGFVPRGPHPDGKSYYPDSSRDQHCAYIEALWRFGRSPLATADDKAFIAGTLAKIARRMERNDWVLKVEDNSRQAHVGYTWKQFTLFGACSLMACLAAAKETTGDKHWAELCEKLGGEKDSLRWKLMSPDSPEPWRPFTLYSNQFFTSLALVSRAETNTARAAAVRARMKQIAGRALHSNVFDETCWRRLDWAGESATPAIEKALASFGLSVQKPATVLNLLAKFDPKRLATTNRFAKAVNEKLLFGIPTVAFHKALLSGDVTLIREAAPHARRMVRAMLEHGRRYDGGENFNRAVILGLHALAIGAR
jgi:hypothetical protein